MNELLDDDVIARLRSALDEVTADSHGLVAVQGLRQRVSAGRWMAAAAAVVLVAGAAATIASHRGRARQVSSALTEVATTAPIPRAESSVSSFPWFNLNTHDFVAGERTTGCCSSTSGPQLVMAWVRADNLAYLMVTELASGSPAPAAGSTVRAPTGHPLLVQSYGLTAAERESVADQLLGGSGLPYVLPADGWVLEAMGTTAASGDLRIYEPRYQDPLSNYRPTVTLSVGQYSGQIALLAQWPNPQRVTVAGYDGWKVTEGDGTVTVFWSVQNDDIGQVWATLRIDHVLAERADGLIADIVRDDVVQTTPTSGDESAPETNSPETIAPEVPTWDNMSSTTYRMGQLSIPAMNVDRVTTIEQGPLPGIGADGETSILWDFQTGLGPPPKDSGLEKLVVGDSIIWYGQDGTESTFEVIGSAVGIYPQAPAGADLQIRAYSAMDSPTLIVYARLVSTISGGTR